MRSATTMTIAGTVLATGISSGLGWTSAKISTGGYLVVLDAGYRLLSALAAVDGLSSSKIAGVSTFTDHSFTVTTITTVPAFADAEFTFVATVQAR